MEVSDDDLAKQQFNATVQRRDGRYEVGWPWKNAKPDLPDNYALSCARLKSLTNRFRRDPVLARKYTDILDEQLKLGIIEKVDSTTQEGPVKHYLPHHPVITPLKNTTKVRIVYDGSSRANPGDKSLNDNLLRGPILGEDLCSLLIRARTKPIFVTSDVERAFLQILLRPEDRDVTRFVYLKDPSKFSLDNKNTE